MMTHVDNAPAGPELDRFIAERVMLNRVSPDGSVTTKGCIGTGAWSPSTNLAHAWEVVEKLEASGWLLNLYSQGGCWSAWIEKSAHETSGRVVADTAPLAICRAAAKAVIR